MLSAAFFTLALATSHGTLGHAPAPVHQTIVTPSRPHRSSSFSTGTLAQVCTNASWLDRLFGKRDECSLVDPRGTSAERAYYQACARHGTTGLLDCHIGYSFKYVAMADRDRWPVRRVLPRMCSLPRRRAARRGRQAQRADTHGLRRRAGVGEKLVGGIAAEASGLELDASSVAVSRTDGIVRELIRPGVIYRDTAAPEIHTIVGNMDDARALFDTLSAGGSKATPAGYQEGGTLVRFRDGTQIGFRPNAGRGTSPAVEIKIPGYLPKQIKFHFTDR